MVQQKKCPKCGEGTMKLNAEPHLAEPGGPTPPEPKCRCDKCRYEADFKEIYGSGSN